MPSVAKRWFNKLPPEGILALSFLILILIGTTILLLPVSTRIDIGILNAFFTATSAATVTGLTVVDTEKYFTEFGQVVILILIQLGGIGVMSFAATIFNYLGIRLSMRAQSAASAPYQPLSFAAQLRPRLFQVILITLTIECIGTIALFFTLNPVKDPGYALWSALFHSVSSFCNAGFSIYSKNLIELQTNPSALFFISILIISGGLGYQVLYDIGNFRFHFKVPKPVLMFHTKIVLLTTGILLLCGFIILFVFNFNGFDSPQKLLQNAMFQSITARTAGFNTVTIGSLNQISLFTLILLMFIGGSPGSCAGGIKTTTLILWLAQLRTRFEDGNGVKIWGKFVSADIVHRASTIIGFSLLWNTAGVFLLLVFQSENSGLSLIKLLFEQISAFGTVGLSTGITPGLNALSKLWLILTMFIGRIGPLSIVVLLSRKKVVVKYPEGKILIG